MSKCVNIASFVANMKQDKEHEVRSFVEVVICAYITIHMFVNQTAILETHINSPLVMSMVVSKQGTILLVSTNS